ncbi:hypothetical protein [Spirochaeta dissipatitropha]
MKHFSRILFFSFFFLCLNHGLEALEIRGSLVDAQSGEPVAWALVVILETEELTESEEDGSFVLFSEIEGQISLRIISDQHLTMDVQLDNIPASPLKIELSPLAVDMGSIEATARRSNVRSSGAVDEGQIRSTATGDNPFALVDRMPDVTVPSQPALDNDHTSAVFQLDNALGSQVFSMINPFHYRGLPYYANAYYLNMQLPLFYQYYSFAGAMLNSIVPSRVVAGMDMFGNGRNPSIGPGAGLLSSMRLREPYKTLEQELYFTSLAAGYILDWGSESGTTGLLFSIRKSLFEFTFIPLVVVLNSRYQWYLPADVDGAPLGFTLLPGTIDAQLKFYHEINEQNRIEIDALNASGYTRLGFEVYDGGVNYSSIYYVDMGFRHLNQQSGILASWTRKHNENLNLKFSLYDIFSWTGRGIWEKWIGGERYETSYNYPLNDAGASLSAEYTYGPATIFTGLSGRYLLGWYERHSHMDEVMYYTPPQDVPPKKGLETGEVAFWFHPLISIGKFDIEPGLRLDWYETIQADTIFDQIRLSPSLHLYYFPKDQHSFHLGAAMRSDRFDYLTRHLFVSQQGMNVGSESEAEGQIIPDRIDDRYVQSEPSRVFSAELEYLFEGTDQQFSAAFHGLHADRLSGFDFQSFHVGSPGFTRSKDGYFFTGSVSEEDAGFREAHKLWSAGVNLSGRIISDTKGFDASYSWAMTRYLVSKQKDAAPEWIVPNSDTSHTIKLYGYFITSKLWEFGNTLRVHIGIPQTPNKIIGIYDGWEEGKTYIAFSPIPDSVNSLRDYMPRFGYDFKISKTFLKPTFWELYLDVANVISFPRYSSPAGRTIGFRERNTLDRKYDWSIVSWADFPSMRIDLGLRIRF